MRKIIGFLAPITLAFIIIVACKKEEVKECPPPANTFSLEYKDSLLIFTYSENSQGLTEIDLGEVGFLPGTGIRRSGKSTAVYNNILRGEEYHYYVRTDCGGGNYSYWVGPIKINTSCYGEATDYYTTTTDSSVTITWNNTPKLVEIEYGLDGFVRGEGNFANSDLDNLSINKLSNGWYSFYARSVWDDGSYCPWMGPYSFEITGGNEFTCIGVTNFSAEVTDISATISFTLNQESDIVEIEYGLGGTIQGSGTVVRTIAGEKNITITDLSPNTEYVYYARTFCRQTNSYSEWKGRYFFETSCDGSPKSFEGVYEIDGQSELDAFASLCYTRVSTLIINAVGDLGPLSGLRAVDSLVVSNSKIENLNGLENLTNVTDFIQLSDNVFLENLEGLDNINNMSFFVSNSNPSLSDYCAISYLWPGSTVMQATGNAYNPSNQDMIDGKCKP